MSRKVLIAATSGAAALLVAAGIGFAATQAIAYPETPTPQATHAPYSHNEAGQSYGSDLGVRSQDEEPDLIAAIGDHGVHGYISSDALAGSQPKSPAEAVAMSKASGDRVIDVYKADGKTKIDTFTISAASGKTYSK